MVLPFEFSNFVDSAASNMTHVHSVENDVLQNSTKTCADLRCTKPFDCPSHPDDLHPPLLMNMACYSSDYTNTSSNCCAVLCHPIFDPF